MTSEPRALLLKCRKDEDFYVAWSEEAQAPVWYGTAAEARKEGYTGERIDRADRTGTSSFPGFYRWDARSLIAEQRGVLPRRFLRAYALLYDFDYMQAAFDLLEPFEDGTGVRRG